MADMSDLDDTATLPALPSCRDEVLAGRYRLSAQIGRGGTSVVWRAHDELLDRDVAVKILSTGIDERFRTAVETEAKATARLTNPHVAHMYDYGETERPDGTHTPFLVMELVRGVSLAEQLADGRALPWKRAATIASEISDALASAHAHGLVHRDIKPGNVLLTDSGVKVIDFGISAIVGSPDIDDDGHIVGTAAYLAPERLTDVPVGAPADIYALGVLLYRCLAGTFPFEIDRQSEVLISHLLAEPYDLPPIAGLPADLAELCFECLRKDPSERPTAAETAIRAQAIAAAPPESSVQRQRPTRRRLLAAAAILAAGAGTVAWATSPSGGTPPTAAAPVPVCAATFSVDRDWGNGFDATVTVTNTSSTTLTNWQIGFTFAGDQHLTGPQSPTTAVEQIGSTVTASAVDPRKGLRPHDSVTVPIAANYQQTNPIPTAVELNTYSCQTAVTGAAYKPAPTPRGTPATSTSTPPSHGKGHGNGNGKEDGKGSHKGKGDRDG